MCIAADRYELTETTSQRTSQSLSGPCAAPMRAPPHASFRPIKQTVGCCCINVTLGNHLSGYTKPVLNRLRLFATLNRIADIAYPWGLDMRRVRFPALSAASFAAVAAAFLFSVSAAHAQCLPSQGSNSATASSWVAGGQAGYDWQQGSFVYGVETDLSGTGLKSSMSGGLSGGSCTTDTANTSADVDWYGTVRGRAGWTTDKVLFYGTGGLAYGSVDLNSNFSTAGLSVNSQTSSIRTGWVAGGGIEYMVQPNLILTLGYQYVDLGTASLASSSTPAGITIGQTASVHSAFQVATVGLDWRFSLAGTTPQGLASKPWEGAYVGGHAGGAWGNDTNATYSSIVAISDVRLKRDIILVGRLDDGLGLYRYRYLWSDTVYVGVMAQEVALIHPKAVVRSILDDYLRVDYGRLGLKLMTLPVWKAVSEARSNLMVATR